MSNRLRHLHAFRLSDGDEEKLTWLLARFHLESMRRKSSTFRCLVRELYGALHAMALEARMPARAAAQREMAPEMQPDPDGELDEYVEESWENSNGDPEYSRLRGEAMEILRNRGEIMDSDHVLAVIGELRLKELKRVPGS